MKKYIIFFKAVWAKRQRFIILLVGITVNSVIFNYAYDYLFYPFVIWKLGVVNGAMVMIPLSTLVCYLLLLFYDWSKKDWLGLESIKQVREYGGSSKAGKFFSFILKKGDLAAMILLSLQFDPFITTAYMRHGSGQYNGLSARDWKIFFSSVVISNSFWVAVTYGGITAVQNIWKMIT